MIHTNRKELLFDAQALLGDKSGVGYYNSILLEQLCEHKSIHSITLIYFENFFSRKYTKQLNKTYPMLKLKAHRFLPKKVALKLLGTVFEPSIGMLWPGQYDSVIFPNFYGFRTKNTATTVLSIPDVAFIDYPEVLPSSRTGIIGKILPSGANFLIRTTKKQVPEADIILTISETVKKELQQRFDLPESRIVVTSLAPPQSVSADEKPNPAMKNHILFVGTVEPRKNLATLLEAYELLPDNVRSLHPLVLVGGLGWKYEKVTDKIVLMQRNGINVRQMGYLSSNEKSSLYENASVYVQPSVYEGFGMPLLEAMSYGIPVVCSDIPVFHEVAKDAAIFFPTKDAHELAKSIKGLIENKSLQESLTQKGKERVNHYRNDSSGVDELVSRL